MTLEGTQSADVEEGLVDGEESESEDELSGMGM